MKDGTLPFDPQRIAEGILEGVRNPPWDRPSQPGRFHKSLLSPRRERLILDVHATSEAPKKRGGSGLKRKSVQESIEWLNSPSRVHPDKTKVELYLEKRTVHENSIKHKDDSYKQALEMSKRDPRNKSVQDQQAAYNRWIAENHKRLNGAIQSAHTDWVTTANKTDVEYHLSIVDLDLDKAVSKVLESQVNFFFASFAGNTYLSDIAGGPYIGVLKVHCVIYVSVYHLVI